jgi:Ca2+-binding RTX toxin-like protein
MAIATIQIIREGRGEMNPMAALQLALAGESQPATATNWEFTGAGGVRVVFHGNFVVDGNGVAQSGTATGFSVFQDDTKLMLGEDYFLSVERILKAADAAAEDDFLIFYAAFYTSVRQIGSADGNNMHGSLSTGEMYGKGGNDNLYGSKGKELIKGGNGDDWIEGRGKVDNLFGGKGADTFAFTNVKVTASDGDPFAVHRVRDFSTKHDSIFLDGERFTALDNGPLDDSTFGYGGRAETRKEHIFLKKKTGELFYDEDGSGKAEKVLFAKFEPGVVLTADHFEVGIVV